MNISRRDLLGVCVGGIISDFISKSSISKTKDHSGNDLFKVAVLKADVSNGNKRIYPRKVLEKIVEKGVPDFGTFYLREDSPTMFDNSSSINFLEVSHTVKNPIIDEEGYLVVEIKVLNTPRGIILKNMLEKDNNSVQFRTKGISSNSLVNQDGYEVIDVESYNLISIFAVESEIAAKLN